jgi:hypothetical protein
VGQTTETVTSVPPFGSAEVVWQIKPVDGAQFTEHTLLVSGFYSWDFDGKAVESRKTATATLTVKRKLESELGGLALGGASAFYFLLPFIPAVTSYHVAQQLRRGDKITLPDFGTKVIAPALVACVATTLLLQAFFLPLFNRDFGADFLEPATFFLVVFLSLAVGAVIPFLMWCRDLYQAWRWDYTGRESAGEILAKALTGPRAANFSGLVDVEVGAEKWTGLLLAEGKDWFVMSAQLSATAKTGSNVPDGLFDGDGLVLDGEAVVENLNLLDVGHIVNINHNGRPEDQSIIRRSGRHKTVRQDTKPLLTLLK